MVAGQAIAAGSRARPLLHKRGEAPGRCNSRASDWVADVFSRYHWGARTPYAAERFDCEDLALEAVVLARKLHAQSTKELHGLACGWLYYTPTKQTLGVQYGNQDHALAWFITGKAGNETILFFEPQRSYTVPLEPEELQSVYGANM